MNKKIKTILPLIIVFALVGTIIAADITLKVVNKSRDLDKAQRDILLTKTEANVIEPNITIKCSEDYCLWSAYQEGITDTRDNKIQRYSIECSLYNETTSSCETETRIDYTDDEIQDLVADAIASRLENYADAEIARDNYVDWGTGNIIIEERK